MDYKTFHAYTMAEALVAVRENLGEDAVILDTRTFKRGGVLGVGRRSIVEVTATPATTANGAGVAAPVSRPARQVAAERAYGGGVGELPVAPRARRPVPQSSARSERSSSMGQKPGGSTGTTRVSGVPTPAEIEIDQPASGEPVRAVARRFVLHPTENGEAGRFTILPPDAVPARRLPIIEPKPYKPPLPGAADRHVRAINIATEVQRRASPDTPAPALPRCLIELRQRMIDQELSDAIVDRVIGLAAGELPAESMHDTSLGHEIVARHLADSIAVTGPTEVGVGTDGRPLTIALVGPTGVGKTTTLAKLAARFKLEQGKRVGLITADTYRIAAVDQLRSYADIIGLPLLVALTPTEMQQATNELVDCDVVLIDTAGRSQNDADRIDQLKGFVRAAGPHQVHLVLAATASERVLAQEVAAFTTVGIDAIVLTKLDEAACLGPPVKVAAQAGRPVSFLTTGQEVPDHLEPAVGRRLAEVILGQGGLTAHGAGSSTKVNHS